MYLINCIWEMVILRKKKIKAYILLESLFAMSVLAIIVSLILAEITRNQTTLLKEYREEETLALARMAVQSQQSKLSLNGTQVSIVESQTSIKVYQDKKEILHVYQK